VRARKMPVRFMPHGACWTWATCQSGPCRGVTRLGSQPTLCGLPRAETLLLERHRVDWYARQSRASGEGCSCVPWTHPSLPLRPSSPGQSQSISEWHLLHRLCRLSRVRLVLVNGDLARAWNSVLAAIESAWLETRLPASGRFASHRDPCARSDRRERSAAL
jgi:hypothetical protein